jgi:beta-mannosidase
MNDYFQVDTRMNRSRTLIVVAVIAACATSMMAARTPAVVPAAAKPLPAPVTLSSGWLMQDIAQVSAPGDVVSSAAFSPVVYLPKPYVPPPTAAANPAANPSANAADRPKNSSAWQQAPAPSSPAWYRATVPGTILTTLVNNNIYPEPLYGENNRPNIIPESLCRTSYWYRTQVTVPSDYAKKHVWLNFDGINYMADVWVNGTKVGEIRGAFSRGVFDVTSLVAPGKKMVVAVLIKPPLIPADPEEQTQQWGLGLNGGVESRDGPTFLASQGWDWMPGIRDRNMGIWQKVSLSATGPVVIRDPYVVTDLPLPSTETADVSIDVTVRNVTEAPQTGVVTGTLGDIAFQSAPVTLAANEAKVVKFSPQTTAQLRVQHPKLWWPNGFGDPHLYPLHVSFDISGTTSDTHALNVGIRKITYQIGDSDNLAVVVNGVPVFAKGGDWGMDEAMKRMPRERLDTLMRLHREANYTILRNWVGQSTSEDFYDLADRYGLMVWDEFFQPYGGEDSGRARGDDGEHDITDVPLYLANVREKVLRFRNHPSIILWCGRNEGDPSPMVLADGLSQLMAELDPARTFHPNSDAGHGVKSGGPYYWQPPANYYGEGRGGRGALVAFKTEIGTVSIPTLEAMYAMMPAADAEHFPNDDWAEHDFATGGGNNQAGNYLSQIKARYGDMSTLPQFVRAAQMADYEAERAMYEGRFAKMFNPANAVITWMSNPAQPSTTWQIYSYDLEPFASFFGVKKACEPLHIQMNQNDFHVMVINHLPAAQNGLTYRVQVFDLDGTKAYDQSADVGVAKSSAATDLGAIAFPSDVAPLQFVKVELFDPRGHVVSDNFYWRNGAAANDLTALNTIPDVRLEADLARHDANGNVLVDVTLKNTTSHVAVMAHVQLRNQRTNVRVLPVWYSDNYVSLLPGESRVITIEAASADLGKDKPLVTLDGWNVTVTPRSMSTSGGAAIAPNTPALVIR